MLRRFRSRTLMLTMRKPRARESDPGTDGARAETSPAADDPPSGSTRKAIVWVPSFPATSQARTVTTWEPIDQDSGRTVAFPMGR